MGEIISKDLKKNIDTLKNIFIDCDDISYRFIDIGKDKKREACFVFSDGLIDKVLIGEYAIQLLLTLSDSGDVELNLKSSGLEKIAKESIAIPGIKEEKDLDKVVDAVLSGETAFFVDKADKALILSSRGWPTRGVGEPDTETVVRGPREGFSETLKINTTLVRRRIRDPKLKIKNIQIGRRSKTDIAIMYIEDIVSQEILKEVNGRLDKIDIDAILDSSMLEFLIEDNYLSPFPQIENTERPDTLAASLYEGRIGILVDNSPFALIVPATIGTLSQSAEDYYSRWTITTIIRWVRLIAAFLSLLAPALYIAITSFHPGLIPTVLTYYLGASRVNVPFPAVIEAYLMELTLELLRESGTRIAGPIGTTIGIVGGLIIGQAAVEAGIVSPLMIIIVAVTTIASFSLPSYEWASGFRFCRFIFMALAGILGLYGIMLGIVVLSTHFARLESFGIPFSAPYSGLGIEEGDLKDTLVKAPIQKLQLRPIFTFPKNRRRMGKR
ncbi:Spore germination protein KA [[Clostridium] ultunense Esp]|uniref:Spore germination protein KA n=1 Tax=[Clostridium] ultunense Esp TaxID=1288971 RepID=M1Z817_9FIRM|nr:spore germination protein [Schnuerera ultunensis]CCQ93894.1 Spore germination protein KA [[Clostridium] ultunense Esp]SHD76183.1 Spore germination protein KA [[Clostridium] ultunense Esp]